jgi:hypothetical protein
MLPAGGVAPVGSFLTEDLKDFARFGYYSGWRRKKMARVSFPSSVVAVAFPERWNQAAECVERRECSVYSSDLP